MQWSKVKSRWKELLAESVADRVDLHLSQYRRAHDGEGDAWFTFDRSEVLRFTNVDIVDWRESQQRDALLKMGKHLEYGINEIGKSSHVTSTSDLPRDWQFSQSDLLRALFFWINKPLEKSLACEHPLPRALAMLDRRVGKRRLKAFHPQLDFRVVSVLHDVRMQCEGSSRVDLTHRDATG
ncbi:MAG: hypothetical protein AAGE65_04055 [Planctomycetota bacterium]